jgi:5-methylcytosine-specific restriction endonuclease McrA
MSNARAFTDRLADLLRREHAAMADFLVALADFDRRRLWLELGHASLFYFLHRELGLSKGAAHYRKTAAELVQKFPEIVEPLRAGQLCITAIVHLAKVLTPENRHEMLPRFFHRSRREAMEVAAAILPAAAPHREVVTAVRTAAAVAPVATMKLAAAPARPAVQPAELRVDPAQAAVQPAEPRLDPDRGTRSSRSEPDRGDSRALMAELPRSASSAPPPPRPAPRDSAEPVTAELSRLHVTVSRRFLAKLEAARAALSHARPGANAEEILEAGLDLVLAAHAKRNALVEKPRKEPPPAKSDRVPAHVRRAVWTRDGGRCRWPLDGGGICGSTLRVEFDHVIPRARGGPPTVDNGRILCAVHNQYAAELAFGDRFMDRFSRKAPAGEKARAGGVTASGNVAALPLRGACGTATLRANGLSRSRSRSGWRSRSLSRA